MCPFHRFRKAQPKSADRLWHRRLADKHRKAPQGPPTSTWIQRTGHPACRYPTRYRHRAGRCRRRELPPASRVTVHVVQGKASTTRTFTVDHDADQYPKTAHRRNFIHRNLLLWPGPSRVGNGADRRHRTDSCKRFQRRPARARASASALAGMSGRYCAGPPSRVSPNPRAARSLPSKLRAASRLALFATSTISRSGRGRAARALYERGAIPIRRGDPLMAD